MAHSKCDPIACSSVISRVQWLPRLILLIAWCTPTSTKPHIPKNEQNHLNVQGGLPGPWIHECMCHTLLQHIDPTVENRQRHCNGCLVIPRGAQYDRLLPEVVRPCNHQVPLMDLKAGEVFPMVLVGDFALEDIFPRTPGDSLLYTSKEHDKLRRKGYQVAKHRLPAPPAETSQTPWHSGEGNNSTHKGREPAKAAGSPDKKSSRTQCSLPTKECQESHDKDRSISKHQEKSQKDKEDSKSLCKHMGSLVLGSSTT